MITRRVLVVDDDPVVLMLITALLRRALWTVETAEHGAMALDRMAEATFDVVISDVQMPVLDGPGLLTRLRADARTTHLPFVLLSAASERPTELEGAAHVHHVMKPVNPRTFVAELDALLG